MDTFLLEEIGLTKGEIAVYLSLLELGSSTVGPIVAKAGVSSSKVYPILDRLVGKGLAGYVVKENTKYFEGAPPQHILQYVSEKKARLEEKARQIQEILPELELRQKLQEQKAGAQIFKGNKGWRTAFDDILHALEQGDECLIMGIYDFDQEFADMILKFHRKRAREGIRARILLNADTREMGGALARLKHTKVRYMQEGVFTPSIFLIYANKVLISLPKQRMFFQIQSDEARTAFAAYFESLWRQDVKTYEGTRACTQFFTDITEDLAPGEEYFVINGNQGMAENPDLLAFFKNYHRTRQKKRIKANILFNTAAKKTATELALPPAEHRFLPPDFQSPLQVTFYKDKLYLALWKKNPIGVLIQRKEIVEAFKAYFENLWSQDTVIWKGEGAIAAVVDDVLDAKSDLHLIGAHGYMPRLYPEEFERLVKGVAANRKNRFHLAREETRNTGFNDGAETHYLPQQFLGPTVIWVYGDIVAHVVWEEEITVFRMKSKKVAGDYRTYFAVLKGISGSNSL